MRAGDRLKAFTALVWALVAILAGLTQFGCSASMLHTFEEPRACMAPFILSVSSGGEWLGSATALGEHTAYTAAHVVDDREEVWLYEVRCNAGGELDYGEQYRARVVKLSGDRDLARLELTADTFDAFGVLRPGPVMLGEPLYIHGVRSHGTATLARSTRHAIGGAAIPGDSGGAVLDAQGRVVGIIYAAVCGRTCSRYEFDDGDFGQFANNFKGVEWVRP